MSDQNHCYSQSTNCPATFRSGSLARAGASPSACPTNQDYRQNMYYFQGSPASDLRNPSRACVNPGYRQNARYNRRGRAFNPANDVAGRVYSNLQSSQSVIDSTRGCGLGRGRAFNPAYDISEKRVPVCNMQGSQTGLDSSVPLECEVDQSYNQNLRASHGRTFDTSKDISGNLSSAVNKHLAQKSDRLNLEYEMAKNKNFAIERLISENSPMTYESSRSQQLAYAARGRAYESSTPPQLRSLNRSRPTGKTLDIRAETRRIQDLEDPLNAYQSRGENISKGRRMDLDRISNYNIPAFSPDGPAGRSFDSSRDLAFRRMNQAPKQQRSVSCPTPILTPNAPPIGIIPPTPKTCRRPTQSNRVSPDRSASLSPANRPKSTPGGDPTSPSKYPVGSNGDSINEARAVVTKTTTNIRQANPEETSRLPVYPKTPDIIPEQYDDRSRRSLTPTQTRQMSYGPSQSLNSTCLSGMDQSMENRFINPRNCPALQRSPSTTPSRPRYEKDTSRNLGITSRYDNQCSRFNESFPDPMRPRLQSPSPESFQYNASMFREPESYRNSCALVDLTESELACDMKRTQPRAVRPLQDRTQQHFISDQVSPCYDPNAQDGVSYPEEESPEECHLTKEQVCPPCPKCDIPQESLFRCLAKKLSSTYNFIASLLLNQEPKALEALEDEEQGVEKTHAGTNTNGHDESMNYNLSNLFASQQCPYTQGPPTIANGHNDSMNLNLSKLIASQQCPQSQCAPTCPVCLDDSQNAIVINDTTTFDLENLFATQFPNNLTSTRRSPDTTFGLKSLLATQGPNITALDQRSLFGDQLTPDSTSARQCANAKRCGRVQFDSSDKREVDPNRSALRQAEIVNLVNDTYCPGIIQETLDGRENFNIHSFNMTRSKESALGGDVSVVEDPMTLLEAFSMRIEQQRSAIEKDLNENATEEQIAATIDKYFSLQNPTDLNQSIKNILLSERLQERAQSQQSKGTTFQADVQKLATTFPDNSNEKLIAFTGHTKPSID